MEDERCPNCGSVNVERDAVDIGVGTQYGPLGCFDCGWYEAGDELAEDDLPIYGPDLPDWHPDDDLPW